MNERAEIQLLEVIQYVFTTYWIGFESKAFLCHIHIMFKWVEGGKKNRLTWIVTQNYTHMPILPYFFARNLIHFTYFLELWHFLGSRWANIIFSEQNRAQLTYCGFGCCTVHTSAHYLVKGTAIILKPTSFYRETLTKLMATYLLRPVHTMNLSWVDHTEWTRRLNW